MKTIHRTALSEVVVLPLATVWDESINYTALGILVQMLSCDDPSSQANHLIRLSSLKTKDGRGVKRSLSELEKAGYLTIKPRQHEPSEWDWYADACIPAKRTNWLDCED